MIGKTITKKVKNKNMVGMIFDEQKTKKIIKESSYVTDGEFLIIVKDVDECNITLNSETTEHIVIKALTKVIVKHSGLIDEYYHELVMDKGSSVELCEVEGVYYIIASDGLKLV